MLLKRQGWDRLSRHIQLSRARCENKGLGVIRTAKQPSSSFGNTDEPAWTGQPWVMLTLCPAGSAGLLTMRRLACPMCVTTARRAKGQPQTLALALLPLPRLCNPRKKSGGQQRPVEGQQHTLVCRLVCIYLSPEDTHCWP